MPPIRPSTDLRDTSEIFEICRKTPEPIFITQKGYGDLVIMRRETYESMLRQQEMDAAIAAAETEYKRDKSLLDAKESFKILRRKHFGEI